MLSDKEFKYRYSTGRKDSPIDFCELALSNSISLDLGLGYFSSGCFNVLSTGFAHFISNGGNMRLYINQYLTADDYDLLRNNKNIDFEERVIQSFHSLKQTLDKRDDHFFSCLSFLITNGRIEIRIVVPKKGGLAHEKFGIFRDENNDIVTFTGSMNMTASAFLKNLETIECICSWKGQDNYERIQQNTLEFIEIWDGKNDFVEVYSGEKFCKEITKTYPDVGLDDLIIQETELVRKLSKSRTKNESDIKISVNRDRIPHFPDKFPTGPREYQKEAYANWLSNGKKGIFAMATGTGKTITSLNCVLNEYINSFCETDCGYYKILILVPTIALVDQWVDEVSLFDFKNIITVYSQNLSWRKDLVSLKNKINRGENQSFVIISTYQSFTNDDFQKILTQLPEDIILIADEAHNIGSESVKEVFRNLRIEKRIALSATPNRIYDEVGTEEIEVLFNDKPPYVYNFSMKKAIDEGYLMEYCYYPRVVFLNDMEMEKYAYLTKELMKMFDSKTGSFKNETLAKRLLMLRKQVLHKAENKLSALSNIIREIGEEHLKFCFVYVPEGKENIDESESYLQDDDSEFLIEKMLQTIKNEFHNTTCNIYTGNINRSSRKALLGGFANGDIDVLLAMKCLDEGIDIPRAEIGIFASSTGNPRQFIQRRGRLLRKHDDKIFAHIYDMIVVPNFQSEHYSKEFFEIEKSLVKGELSRVSYFASLAINTHFALNCLDNITNHYNFSLSNLILNVTQ